MVTDDVNADYRFDNEDDAKLACILNMIRNGLLPNQKVDGVIEQELKRALEISNSN